MSKPVLGYGVVLFAILGLLIALPGVLLAIPFFWLSLTFLDLMED